MMRTVYVIGIDFGSTNSCVTFATYREDENGKLDPRPLSGPEAIPFDHSETIPTAVLIGDDEGQPSLYGSVAEEKAATLPDRAVSGFKLRLGQPGQSGGEAFRLTKQFLGHLRTRVAEIVPIDQPSESQRVETVVGYPVQWSADQREETRRAAQEAGFPNVRVEEEPLAALYAHLCDDLAVSQPELGNRVLMIDMGGGTTDFAFLQIPSRPGQRPISRPVDPAPIVPAWRAGATSYGGRDLDELLLAYLARDWGPAWVARYRITLLREVRRFKEAFSNRLREGADQHEAAWLVAGRPCRVSLTRAEFERVAGDAIAHFEALVRAALALANLQPDQVSTLLLTGGHSRWYFVDETLRQVFPHLETERGSVLRHPQPEQSVARGLACSPQVREAGTRLLAPVRKSAHSLWISVPYGVRIANRPGGSTGAQSATPAAVPGEPVLLMPRGRELPFRSPQPIRIAVNQLGEDTKEATLHIRFFSSAGGDNRMPLYDRVARFERGAWESLLKRFSRGLPWSKSMDEDQFELQVACEVDENELLSTELVIIRYYRGREVAKQRQKLQVSRGAALPIGESSAHRQGSPRTAVAFA